MAVLLSACAEPRDGRARTQPTWRVVFTAFASAHGSLLLARARRPHVARSPLHPVAVAAVLLRLATGGHDHGNRLLATRALEPAPGVGVYVPGMQCRITTRALRQRVAASVSLGHGFLPKSDPTCE